MSSKSNHAPGPVYIPHGALANRRRGPIPWQPGVLAAVVVLGSLLVLAVASNPGRGAPKTVEVRAAQAGSLVTLRTGDTLVVTLEGNMTTGYTWRAIELDTTILQALGEPEFSPSSSALGAGGSITNRFQAVGSGSTILQLNYARPFETGVAPLQTFTVNVQVTWP